MRQTLKYKIDYSPISKVVTTALFNLRVCSMSNMSIQGKSAGFGEDKKKELFPLWRLIVPTPKVSRKPCQRNRQTTIRVRGLDLGLAGSRRRLIGRRTDEQTSPTCAPGV